MRFLLVARASVRVYLRSTLRVLRCSDIVLRAAHNAFAICASEYPTIYITRTARVNGAAGCCNSLSIRCTRACSLISHLSLRCGAGGPHLYVVGDMGTRMLVSHLLGSITQRITACDISLIAQLLDARDALTCYAVHVARS
jgi:hypothetical protein